MILKKELQRIRENTNHIASIEQALAVLDDHRVIYFLRAFGRPMRDHNSTSEFLAHEGAYNAGWHDAIDALVNFKEMFLLEPNKQAPNLRADYGGRRALFESGAITEKEYNQLGHNTFSTNAQSGKPATPKL